MAGLHYLKQAFGLSDEMVVKSWVENPYWQYFCGEEYFQHRLPIDPSQMTRFRTPAWIEWLREIAGADDCCRA
jgi:IS5 family transposase